MPRRGASLLSGFGYGRRGKEVLYEEKTLALAGSCRNLRAQAPD